VEQKIVLNLACIVEGKGELEAMRVLMNRLSEQSNGEFWVEVAGQPIRTRRGKLVKENDDSELTRTIALAVGHMPESAATRGILILIDADDDCPAELGPELLRRAASIRSDIPISVVLAKREYEGWFLAGFEGICGRHGFPADIPEIGDPELIRDAKGRLTAFRRSVRPNSSYKPTVDQAALTRLFDLERARERSPSFEKLWRAIRGLAGGVHRESSG
jgi:hypothetical protein